MWRLDFLVGLQVSSRRNSLVIMANKRANQPALPSFISRGPGDVARGEKEIKGKEEIT
jgi:hypothetical protein